MEFEQKQYQRDVYTGFQPREAKQLGNFAHAGRRLK
jgi:hypothetical protein